MKHKPFLAIMIVAFTFVMSTLIAEAQGTRAPRAVITVNSTAQEVPFVTNGNCTLGEAIQAANTDAAVDGCTAGAGADEIIVPAGTYTLTAVYNSNSENAVGLPRVTSPLTITGALSNTTIIVREPSAPQFTILDTQSTLTLNNLTLRNGNHNYGGGAVNYSGATLIVNDSTFINNYSSNGGALGAPYFPGTLTVNRSLFISNTGGSGGAILATANTTISNSAFYSNTATSWGGALRGTGSGVLNITDSIFEGNSGTDYGGAISSNLVTNITGSVIRGNTLAGSGGGGGGIHAESAATTTVISSTIANNVSPWSGGGIRNEGTLTMIGSTVSGNTANNAGGGVHTTGDTTIRNSTISSNSAAGAGGGIYAATPDGGLNLYNVTITSNATTVVNSAGGIFAWGGYSTRRAYTQNTLIAGNTNSAGGSPDCYTDGGALLVSNGYTLLGNNTGCTYTSGTGDIVGTAGSPVNAQLGPLDNYGGATQTHPLTKSSPALNAGNPATPGSGGSACEATDQRGIARPVEGRCDIGAFEGFVERIYLPYITK